MVVEAGLFLFDSPDFDYNQTEIEMSKSMR